MVRSACRSGPAKLLLSMGRVVRIDRGHIYHKIEMDRVDVYNKTLMWNVLGIFFFGCWRHYNPFSTDLVTSSGSAQQIDNVRKIRDEQYECGPGEQTGPFSYGLSLSSSTSWGEKKFNPIRLSTIAFRERFRPSWEGEPTI
jgi:hypothetical protein